MAKYLTKHQDQANKN